MKSHLRWSVVLLWGGMVTGQEGSVALPSVALPSGSVTVAAGAGPRRTFSPIVIPADPATLMESLDDRHLLARRDKMVYVVVEDRDEPRELVITDLGEINVPYLGRVHAEGKTCKALANEIKTALEKDLYRRATVVISVLILSGKRGTVYLAGEVRSIGPQILPSDETLTLSKAILRAGGFGDFANQKKVKILRRSSATNTDSPEASPIQVTTLLVDVKAIIEDGELSKDVELLPDDFIFVPSRWINF